MLRKLNCSLLFLLVAVTSVVAQKNILELEKWLDKTDRGQIEKQKFAKKALSKEDAERAGKLIFEKKQSEIKRKFSRSWQEKSFSRDGYTMKFDYRVFGVKPEGGRSLYISMHGGGNAPASVNDQQWHNQVGLYKPEEGIYVAPRAAVDDWNMWFQPHIDLLFDDMIQSAVAIMGVNPDKVYIMGYSAGGDGVYRMAPRMADRWAAASMMAGHPGDVSPLNLRNIGFTSWVGEHDGAYNRNSEVIRFGKELDSLCSMDPKGYVHKTHVIKGKGHWMDLEDAVAVPWMAEFKRDPLPLKVVWRQDDTPHDSFYWLEVPLDEADKGNLAIVERDGNSFTILHNDYKTLRIGLNDNMIDFNQPVKIIVDGKVVYDKKVNRSVIDIYNSIERRKDPQFIFSSFITVPNN